MATLASLLVKLGLDATDFHKGADSVGGKLSSLGNKVSKVGTQMKSTGRDLTQGLSLPIVALGGFVVKTAMDFETSMAGVRKSMPNASDFEFAQITQGIRDLAKELPASVNEIAAVAASAAQLGVEKENILGFTKTMIQLGSVTNLSAEDAGNALARLANITRMPQAEFDKLGATVLALGNVGASTEADIVSMAMRIAGAGNQVGLTVPQILGFANALSSVGIDAEAGGTAISRSFITMAQAVNKGGTELGVFAKTAGMSSKQFQKAFKDDAASAMIAFITGLDRVSKSGGNVFDILDKVGLGEIRVRDAMLRAAGAGDLFANSIKVGNEAWGKGTALQDAAARKFDTTAAKLKILWNQVKDVAITFGSALLPVLTELVSAAGPVVQWLDRMGKSFSNLSPGVRKLIVIIAAIVAAIGPVLMVIGVMVTTIGAAISFIAPIFGAIAGAIAFLASPITLIVIAIAALAYIIYRNWGTIRDFLLGVWRTLVAAAKTAWNAVTRAVKTAVSATVGFIVAVWSGLIGAVKAIWNGIVGAIKAAWHAVDDYLGGNLSLLVANIVGTFKMLWGLLVAVWNLIVIVFRVAVAVIGAVIGAWLAVVKALITTGFSVVSAFFQVWWGIVQAIFTVATAFLSAYIEAWWTVVSTIFKVALEIIGTYISVWWDIATAMFKVGFEIIKAVISVAWEVIKGIVRIALTGIITIINVLLALMRGDIGAAFDAIKGFIGVVWDTIKAIVVTAWHGIVNVVGTAIGELISLVTTIPGKIIEALGDIGSLLLQAGEDLMKGFIKGIKNMAGALKDAAMDVVKGAVNGVKSFLHIGSPSKLFEQIGKWTMQGLAQGIAKTGNDAVSASNAVARKLTTVPFTVATFDNGQSGGSTRPPDFQPPSPPGLGAVSAGRTVTVSEGAVKVSIAIDGSADQRTIDEMERRLEDKFTDLLTTLQGEE